MNYPIDIALVAIMKNEGDYIREWLDYHILLGIKKFYLYDNGSTDMTRVMIQPYVKAGLVEYIFWPGKAQQLRVYNDALEKHRLDCRYLGFIDIDEYIFQANKVDLFTMMEALFTDYRVAALGINWRLFGSSFRETKPKGGVLINFVYRAADTFEYNEHIKSFVNPRRCWYMRNAHYGLHFAMGKTVNWQGKEIHEERILSNDKSPFYINHYFTKSKEEWVRRRSLGKADINGKRSMEEFYLNGLNDIYDNSIINLQLKLKNKTNNKDVLSYSWEEKLRNDVDALIKLQQNNEPLLEKVLLVWYACRRHERYSIVEKVDDIFQELLLGYLTKTIYPYEQDLLARVLNKLPLNSRGYRKVVERLIVMMEQRYNECYMSYCSYYEYAEYLWRILKALKNN